MASDKLEESHEDPCRAVTYQNRYRGRLIKRQCDDFCLDFLSRDPGRTILKGVSHVFDNRDATSFFFGGKFALHEFSITIPRPRNVLVIGSSAPTTEKRIPTIDALVRVIVQRVHALIGADRPPHHMGDLCTLSTSVATQLAHCCVNSRRKLTLRSCEKCGGTACHACHPAAPLAWYRQYIRDRLTDAYLDDCILVAARQIKAPHVYAMDQILFDDPAVHTHALTTGVLRLQLFKRERG